MTYFVQIPLKPKQTALLIVIFWSTPALKDSQGPSLYIIKKITCDTTHVPCDTWHVTGDTWHVQCDTWHVTGDTWQVTGDTWQVTPDMWQVTCDMWHLTGDTWHVTVGGRLIFSKNFSTLALTALELRFIKDLEEKAELMNEWVTEVVVEQPWRHRFC